MRCTEACAHTTSPRPDRMECITFFCCPLAPLASSVVRPRAAHAAPPGLRLRPPRRRPPLPSRPSPLRGAGRRAADRSRPAQPARAEPPPRGAPPSLLPRAARVRRPPFAGRRPRRALAPRVHAVAGGVRGGPVRVGVQPLRLPRRPLRCRQAPPRRRFRDGSFHLAAACSCAGAASSRVIGLRAVLAQPAQQRGALEDLRRRAAAHAHRVERQLVRDGAHLVLADRRGDALARGDEGGGVVHRPLEVERAQAVRVVRGGEARARGDVRAARGRGARKATSRSAHSPLASPATAPHIAREAEAVLASTSARSSSAVDVDGQQRGGVGPAPAARPPSARPRARRATRGRATTRARWRR